MKSKIITALMAVGMMVSIANATDVTKFKIDGVGLGDSYDKVKKKLPCNDKPFDDGIGGWSIGCNSVENQKLYLKSHLQISKSTF